MPFSYRSVCSSYLFTYLLTYSMVQSISWEANWFAASQEIPRISRNPKVHYRTHKGPPPVSILGQPNPVHIPTSHLLETHPNIHPSTPMSPQWSLSGRFPHQDPIHPLSSPIRVTCPAHLILLDFITRTILGEEYKSFSSLLCFPSGGVVYLRTVLSPEESSCMWVFLNMNVLQRGVVSTSPNPQAGGRPLVGCPRLLIQFIRSYPPYRSPFLYPQPEDAPCRGDTDPLHDCN